MNLLVLIWGNLWARPLYTLLNVLLLGLGISIVIVLLLVNTQLSEKIRKNTKGIDLVAGAKGSPLQIILCSIFHMDYPTGNIPLDEAERVARHPLVKKAIPMALGDSYHTFRIVGTDTSYCRLYDGSLAAGQWWSNELDVVLGSDVALQTSLRPGDFFSSAHGFSSEGTDHSEHRLRVQGVLSQSGTVLDNIILTSVQTVWAVHGSHSLNSDSTPVTAPSRLVPSVERNDSTREITSLLIQFRSPLAAMQLPRWINSNSRLQAASPAFETERLFSLLGVGVDVIMGFASVLIGISALSVFIALYNSLKERRYDLAIMRSMGASRVRLFLLILAEGGTLTILGGALGVLLGHIAVAVFVALSEPGTSAGLLPWIFVQQEAMILAGSLVIGLISSLLPAVQAYRTDISKTLAGQ